jgi:hypothetical protein
MRLSGPAVTTSSGRTPRASTRSGSPRHLARTATTAVRGAPPTRRGSPRLGLATRTRTPGTPAPGATTPRGELVGVDHPVELELAVRTRRRGRSLRLRRPVGLGRRPLIADPRAPRLGAADQHDVGVAGERCPSSVRFTSAWGVLPPAVRVPRRAHVVGPDALGRRAGRVEVAPRQDLPTTDGIDRREHLGRVGGTGVGRGAAGGSASRSTGSTGAPPRRRGCSTDRRRRARACGDRASWRAVDSELTALVK